MIEFLFGLAIGYGISKLPETKEECLWFILRPFYMPLIWIAQFYKWILGILFLCSLEGVVAPLVLEGLKSSAGYPVYLEYCSKVAVRECIGAVFSLFLRA